MASLTPLSKGLIALVVGVAVGSAVWYLGLEGEFAEPVPPVQPAALPSDSAENPVSSPDEPDSSVFAAMSELLPASTASAPASTKASTSGQSAVENTEVGRKHMDRGDFAQARAYFEAAVKGGDGAAACHLGEMTLKGQGGIQASQEKAAELFRFAQAHSIICFASGG